MGSLSYISSPCVNAISKDEMQNYNADQVPGCFTFYLGRSFAKRVPSIIVDYILSTETFFQGAKTVGINW